MAKNKADKYTRMAWRWCETRGIGYLHVGLAKMLRRIARNAEGKALLEGIRTGGRVAIGGMRSGRK